MPKSALHRLFGATLLILLLQGCATTFSDDRRDRQTVRDDKTIELAIGQKIFEHPDLKRQAHVNINSFNGTVLISGETSSKEKRALIADIARRVANVKKVYNEMTVDYESGLGSRSRDSWITTRIVSALAAHDDISAGHIKVVTEAQTVFLMGIVSRKEADIATEISQKTDRVKRVIRLFEYQD